MPISHRIDSLRSQGPALMRDAMQQVRNRGAGGLSHVRTFVLAYPPLIEGIYYLLTGLWPLLHMPSFLAVTGPKTDLWLVQTVGALVLVVGVVLCLSAYHRNYSVEIWVLGGGAALALTCVDVIFVLQRRIPPIYLLDAAVEVALVCIWVYAWMDQRRSSPTTPVRG